MFTVIVKTPELFGTHTIDTDTGPFEDVTSIVEWLLPGYADSESDEQRYTGRVLTLVNIAMALQMREYEKYEQEHGHSIVDDLPATVACTVANDQKQAPLEPKMREWPLDEVRFIHVADTMGDDYPDGLCYLMCAENETLFLRSLVHVGCIEIYEK